MFELVIPYFIRMIESVKDMGCIFIWFDFTHVFFLGASVNNAGCVIRVSDYRPVCMVDLDRVNIVSGYTSAPQMVDKISAFSNRVI